VGWVTSSWFKTEKLQAMWMILVGFDASLIKSNPQAGSLTKGIETTLA
jgi:hypothetical protein